MARRARVVSRATVPEAGTSSSRAVGETLEPLCASPLCAQPWSCAAACQSQCLGRRGVESDSCAKPAPVICLPLICAFVCLVCLFLCFSPQKCSVYFSLYLSSPFIAGKNFCAPFSFVLVLFFLSFHSRGPIINCCRNILQLCSSAARRRWEIWVGGLWEEPDK